jgi:LPXTG-motif cell wall-anchored protein
LAFGQYVYTIIEEFTMIKRSLALGASVLAFAAGSVVVMAAPASASAVFAPTTGIEPGTMFNGMTITAEPGNFLCEWEGTETSNGDPVQFGMYFLSSADTVPDFEDDWIGATRAESVPYVAGATTSVPFDLEMPVLDAHDPANNILAIPFCFDETMEFSVDQGSYVIEYSDATFAAASMAAGGTNSVSLIDGTDEGLSCDVAYSTGPYSLALQFYPSVDAFYDDEEPALTLPEGWDNDGPGLGSFEGDDLPGGVSASFTVPATLAAGDYVVAVYCLNTDGFWGDSPRIGLLPLTITATLPATGVNGSEVAAIAALGASLIALGGIVWVLRRRSAKA